MDKWIKQKTSGDEIDTRCGHSSTYYNNKLYILGGFMDVNQHFCSTPDFFEFNLTKKEFHQIEKNLQYSRQLHSSILYKDIIYFIFGTLSFHLPPTNERYQNSIVTYNLTLKQWNLLETKKFPIPERRFKHSSILIGDSIYIFGGSYVHLTFQYFNDVWRFDLKENKWEEIVQVNETSHRMAHGCAHHGDLMYIFGGKDHYERWNDLEAFNIKKKIWVKFPKEGNVPSKRAGCSLTYYKNSLYMFGGFDGKFDLSDLYKYDLILSKWIKIQTKNEIPGRSFHSVNLIQSERVPYLFLFGGIYEYDKQKVCYNDCNILILENDAIFENISRIEMYQDVIIKFFS